jgi:hypothetical protein
MDFSNGNRPGGSQYCVIGSECGQQPLIPILENKQVHKAQANFNPNHVLITPTKTWRTYEGPNNKRIKETRSTNG